MIILAIDTSAREGSIALSINGQLTGPVRFGMEDSHLVSIGSTVESLLKEQGVEIGNIDRIALTRAREVSPDTYVNVMAQYRPAWKVSAEKYAEINRPPTASEHRAAVQVASEAGLRLDERRFFGLWMR